MGAAEPFEHFKKVSGVPATKAAIGKLYARLAARGAPHPRAAFALCNLSKQSRDNGAAQASSLRLLSSTAHARAQTQGRLT